MSTEKDTLSIHLNRTGGSGSNTQWQWELRDAAGAVVKKGTALGEEHKAFATAKKFRDKIAG